MTSGTLAARTPILAAEGLHAHYGPSHIVRGVDFSVDAGETVALMGRNGMGKTTLLRSILGLMRPSGGKVMIDGRAMTGAKTHRIARAGIAFVPEGRGIFRNLTVREHLAMAAYGGRHAAGGWTLERVLEQFPRLGERLGHLGERLSGGEQQMLTIGRALMTNPRLLILDEATEGLAPLVRREIWAVIHRLKEAGMASVIVDKNATTLLGLADRIVILVKGQAVFTGSSAELKAKPDAMHAYLGI
ncbi:MAG: ABC transporter ATP-binding protein [Proteobacteria bacterium]|nr:ABC transporter ATP-binding protein [Pseudomonadota bacterium]MBI3496388.1 ABC transporter ATP-binding protein [Pseudomonadota bacterium]